jgi:Tfp pilus assembly protein PilX
MARIGRRREAGSALFITMLLLVLMGLIGFAALETVSSDQQVAGFQNRKRAAFYAAEAGIAVALDNLQATGTPSLVTTVLGDTATYPHGQPSVGLDPNVAEPVKDLGIGGADGYALGGTAPGVVVHFWRIRVEGQAPGGTTSFQEVVVGLPET